MSSCLYTGIEIRKNGGKHADRHKAQAYLLAEVRLRVRHVARAGVGAAGAVDEDPVVLRDRRRALARRGRAPEERVGGLAVLLVADHLQAHVLGLQHRPTRDEDVRVVVDVFLQGAPAAVPRLRRWSISRAT